MVDINLIGEDNIGEEKTREDLQDVPDVAQEITQEAPLGTEPVDELSQTSSLDTQELAFEERTETFDTTKTAGFAHGRNPSSLNILMIAGGIVLVAGLLWFFIFRDSTTGEQPLEAQTTPTQDTGEPDPVAAQPANTESDVADLGSLEELPTDAPTESTSGRTIVDRPVVTEAPAQEPARSIPGDFSAKSAMAIESVTEVLGSLGSSLNTTLLSYAGQKIRFEFVASVQRNANEIAAQFNQRFGSVDFTVLSEREVSVAGQAMKKVLVSGTVSSIGQVNGRSGVLESWDVRRIENWVRSTADQFGLEIRQLKSQKGNMSDGHMKTPLLARLTGSKASLVDFMEAMSSQRLNIELTKILLVSPDMVTFSDERLILVLSMFVHES